MPRMSADGVALFGERAEADRCTSVETLTSELLFARHLDDVYRMVGRLLGPGAREADVEDAVQQVFLQAHRALPRFRGDSRVTTWLYGIATRVVLTQLRSWGRQRRLREALEIDYQPPAPVSPEQGAAGREALRTAWLAISRLSPKKRVVYVLFEIEGKSGEEIAEILEIKLATVWTRLHHARRDLARILDREELKR